MKRLILTAIVVAAVALAVACGSSSEADGLKGATDDLDLAASAPAATVVPRATPALAAAAPAPAAVERLAFSEEGEFAAATDLETAQRKVISTAFVSLEVEVVPSAVAEVRAIAEGLGGFVEQQSRSGGPNSQQANMTVRVPQAQFFTALERIEALGEVRDQSVGSEDVTERFIDLEARLKSATREEQSLLSLLDKVRTVGDIISIERELSRVRSEIERLQGQLNFLERRVDLATIVVSLFSPREDFQPPSGSLTVEVSKVAGSADAIKALIASMDGVVDRSLISIQDENETAFLSLRVFPLDFQRAMISIEGQGKIQSKQLQEGKTPEGKEAKQPKEPNARIEVSLVEKSGGWTTGLIIAVAAPSGGVVLAALLGFLFYVTFRAGRRKGISE